MLLGTCYVMLSRTFSVSEDEYIVTPVSSHKLHGIHVDNTLS